MLFCHLVCDKENRTHEIHTVFFPRSIVYYNYNLLLNVLRAVDFKIFNFPLFIFVLLFLFIEFIWHRCAGGKTVDLSASIYSCENERRQNVRAIEYNLVCDIVSGADTA